MITGIRLYLRRQDDSSVRGLTSAQSQPSGFDESIESLDGDLNMQRVLNRINETFCTIDPTMPVIAKIDSVDSVSFLR